MTISEPASGGVISGGFRVLIRSRHTKWLRRVAVAWEIVKLTKEVTRTNRRKDEKKIE